jgi:hypothetical protein
MTETHVVEILALLNVAQIFLWGVFTHKLINKLMCRDLAEYKLVTKRPVSEVVKFKEEDLGNEEEEILSELNGMFKRAD